MTSVFHKILRAVAGAMEIPDVVFLVLALGFAVFSVGWLICEYFTEHRHMREDLPRLLDALREQGADTAALIRKSQLNRRQKAALLELTEHPDFSSGLRESLAANLLEREQSHYDHILKCTELVSKLAPMLGLLGTLIPLGPGIIALGQGDTQTLSTSLLTAFAPNIRTVLLPGETHTSLLHDAQGRCSEAVFAQIDAFYAAALADGAG